MLVVVYRCTVSTSSVTLKKAATVTTQSSLQANLVCYSNIYSSKSVHILQAVVSSLRNTLLVLWHHGITSMYFLQWSSDVCIDSKYADLVHVRQFCHNQHKNCYRIEEEHRLLVVGQMRCNQIPGRTRLRIYATRYDNINLSFKNTMTLLVPYKILTMTKFKPSIIVLNLSKMLRCCT